MLRMASYTRLSRHYRPAHAWADVLLNTGGVADLLCTSGYLGRTMLLNMNVMWERAVQQMAADAAGPLNGVAVSKQQAKHLEIAVHGDVQASPGHQPKPLYPTVWSGSLYTRLCGPDRQQGFRIPHPRRCEVLHLRKPPSRAGQRAPDDDLRLRVLQARPTYSRHGLPVSGRPLAAHPARPQHDNVAGTRTCARRRRARRSASGRRASAARAPGRRVRDRADYAGAGMAVFAPIWQLVLGDRPVSWRMQLPRHGVQLGQVMVRRSC